MTGMKNDRIQITFAEMSDEYKQFVEKFEPKKTTDDCYTPPNVYEAVKNHVCRLYGVREEQIVRPFWPGGDYQREPYGEDSVVVDNPPFSILAEIIAWYNAREIPFFLFAPYLTNFTSKDACCHVITPVKITYENGAKIDTSFVTNMDDRLVVGDLELFKALEDAEKENRAKEAKVMPKYIYPDEVLTAAMVGWIVTKGIPYELKKEDAFFIRKLDSQTQAKKGIYGGGFLLSEKAAAEKAAAEKWPLSQRERQIVEMLGGRR